MPKITALIHTSNDGLRLGRALDSLRACDQIIVIDHGSDDNTEKIARSHGAEFKNGIPGVDRGTYAVDASHDWILCLCANESLSEPLEASLFEWKDGEHEVAAYRMQVREETDGGWQIREPETRLVNRKKLSWTSDIPPNVSSNDLLLGEILRFNRP